MPLGEARRAEAFASSADPTTTVPTNPLPPTPRYDHLIHLTHAFGVWEHAEITTPRVEHGFCTDDNARALIVVSREPDRTPVLDALAATYLRFVLDARMPDGTFRNRRADDGTWSEEVGSDDSQGRAWWGLGVAAVQGRQPWMQRSARAAFASCGAFTSVHLRSNAFAALGAAELLGVDPTHLEARALLARVVDPLVAAALQHAPWFEPHLSYDNARLPEALLAAGDRLGDEGMTRLGLRTLNWLVGAETVGPHFSFVPHGGWVPGESRPGFDQQPLEAAAMAEACHRAWMLTGEDMWRHRGLRAADWFLGRNDTTGVLYDRSSGGTRDGLMLVGQNENQGAESTLAGLAALQIAAHLVADETADVA